MNRDVQRAFEDAGVEVAFPTRTVRLEGGDGAADPVDDGEVGQA